MTLDFDRAPEPPTRETNFLRNDVPAILQARRWKRVEEYERKGIEVAQVPDELRVVDDERNDAETFVYRHSDGRIFERHPRHPEITTRPDLVGAFFDGGELELIELHELDADHYRLAVERHRAEVERAESERLAALEAERRAREEAPRHVVCMQRTWNMTELLDAVEATSGELRLIDDRVLLLLPPPGHLIGVERQFLEALALLRPLLVATRLGVERLPCDVGDCTDDAVTVASGGGFLCLEHAPGR
jgi:hypothetical protein